MNKRMKWLVAIAFALVPAQPILAYQDISPVDAYSDVATAQNTFIIDVRTPEEWRWAGHPGLNSATGEGGDLQGKVINVSYEILKKGALMVNRHFVADVEAFVGDAKHEVSLILMCRSGNRSERAAELLEVEGYAAVYNMVTGFEGGKGGASGIRDQNGWKVDGLPYNDSRAGAYQVREGGAYGN